MVVNSPHFTQATVTHHYGDMFLPRFRCSKGGIHNEEGGLEDILSILLHGRMHRSEFELLLLSRKPSRKFIQGGVLPHVFKGGLITRTAYFTVIKARRKGPVERGTYGNKYCVGVRALGASFLPVGGCHTIST